MPPSSDLPSSLQHSAVDPSLLYQEEATRRRSPGRKGQGKKSKKYDPAEESMEGKRSSTGLPPTMASPSSIISQLHASTSPPATHSNGVTSPLLEAWEHTPTKHYLDPPPQSTRDWTSNIPYGRSPPQNHSSRASMAGSPPQYQSPLDGVRGGFAHTSPPTSPRAAYRQPLQRTSDYQSFGDYLGSSPNNRRPPSMHSQNSPYPPPPHHQQPHFYGAPEIDFGMPKANSEDRKSVEGCCRVFDSLPSTSHEGPGNPEDVLLVGLEHGLNVYHVDKKRFDCIGCLEGLRGSVIGARVLSSELCAGHRAAEPLVAVIIHGPFVPPGNSALPGTGQPEDEEFDASRSMLQAMHVADVIHYQTTVEIHSLRKGEPVATLFRSPKVEARSIGYDGQLCQPPPLGDLKIQINGKFLVVSSGTSGEVFLFESAPSESRNGLPSFRCIGKVWTRISPTSSRNMSISSSESDSGGVRDDPTRKYEAAISSLSHRWLAVVPPPSSAQTTLHGQIETETPSSKIPGVSSHTSPAEPHITCDLDTPRDGSVLNKVARDVAQSALKSAQWVAAEGMQAWNNYWSKPSEQNRSAPAGSPPNHPFTIPLPSPQSFPPTHAQDYPGDRARTQLTLVSILDLEKLSQSQHLKPTLALQPLATFSLQLGCSVLSFSPNGLNLLTASAKGDEQHVWDLMRMIHGEAGRGGDPEASPKGPSIRQIAHFSRMTEAKIVDVVWTEPRGERLAIVTERGTVHIYDLPPSAFQWPPFRRTQRSNATPSSSDKRENKANNTVRPQSVGESFGSAFGMFAGKTQSVLGAVRGRRPSTGSGFSGFGGLAMTAGAGAKGGKAVAVGINRSVSAAASGTVNTIRHFGENRLALPASSSAVTPGCARWLNGKSQARIAVTGGDIVRIYSIRQSSNPKAGQRRPSVVADRPEEFSLPKKKTFAQKTLNDQQINIRTQTEASTSGSFWLPQLSRPPSRRSNLDPHPLSYAEIETNHPYRPFHTDHRVNLFVYDEDATTSVDPHHLHDSSPWVFGGAIPATKISFGSASHDEEDPELSGPGRMENNIRVAGPREDGEQYLISTTRPTHRKKGTKVEGAELFDEEEIFEDAIVVDYADERV